MGWDDLYQSFYVQDWKDISMYIMIIFATIV